MKGEQQHPNDDDDDDDDEEEDAVDDDEENDVDEATSDDSDDNNFSVLLQTITRAGDKRGLSAAILIGVNLEIRHRTSLATDVS